MAATATAQVPDATVTPPAAVSPPVAAASPAPAAPVSTAPAAPTPAGGGGQVLYPSANPPPGPLGLSGAPQNAGNRGGGGGDLTGLVTTFLGLLALCAAGFFFLRQKLGFQPAPKGPRRLVVSETRMLGNRQFLLVVEYENQRMLLGVSPGKIDHLCVLPAGAGGAVAAVRAEDFGARIDQEAGR